MFVGVCGTGENVETVLFSVIHLVTHKVPEFREFLPFVKQPWRGAAQDLFGGNLHGEPRLLVGVEPNMAPGDLQRRCGFPTGFWTANKDGTRGLKPAGKFVVGKAFPIFHVVNKSGKGIKVNLPRG
jgi:hypothetical protein